MGDGYMDVGGRATHGAVAEGWGDGVLACEDDTQTNCAQHTKAPSPLMGEGWGEGVYVAQHQQ
jgi:hypothetical protein